MRNKNKMILGGMIVAILLIAVVAIVSISNWYKENAPANGEVESQDELKEDNKIEDSTDEVVLQDTVKDESEEQKEETTQEDTKQEDTKQEDTKEEETKKEETKKEESKKEENKKEESDKKEEQKEEKEESKKEEDSKIEVIPGQHRDPNNIVVVIDPGHQGKGDKKKEPNGPGSSTMKARVTSGATGVSTKVPEYILNLDVSLKLKTELENRGYTVYMTRSTHDVNISNMERAQYATSVGADIAVRIHGNSIDKSSVRGAETLCPSEDNQYVSHLAKASYSLSKKILNAYCEATGFKNRGVHKNDTMTGMNWSEVPVSILELGFMSNPTEDELLQDADMQNNMVQGIANGIDAYFGL